MCGWWLVVVGFLHHVCPSVFYPNYNTNHHPPSTITGSQWDTDESTPSSLGSGVTVLKIQVGFIYLHIYFDRYEFRVGWRRRPTASLCSCGTYNDMIAKMRCPTFSD